MHIFAFYIRLLRLNNCLVIIITRTYLELKKPGGQWSLQPGIFFVFLTVKFTTYDFSHALRTNPVTNEIVKTWLDRNKVCTDIKEQITQLLKVIIEQNYF
jgi:hypothetical protein